LYGLYLYAGYLQFNQKTAELPDLHLYPVQESHATRAYSWYASYPKINDPTFDRTVSKIVNDAKAAFLARVNFQAKTEHPQDDLNVSFELGEYGDRYLTVTMMKRQALNGKNTKSGTLVAYDRRAKRVVSKRKVDPYGQQPAAAVASDDSSITKTDCKKVKCVALTFDGGPNYVTPKILDTLKIYKAKATFFEVGAQARLYPSVARRTAREGHEVGSMGENYRNLLAAPLEDAKQDIAQGNEAIQSVTGRTPRLVRAPYGAMTDDLAQKFAVPFVGWGISSTDEIDERQIYDLVMANVHSGAIVASNDTSNVTATAYTRIIPELIKRGYKLVTVSELRGGPLEPGTLTEN
jgi:peptidoglycan/xylan/chitin deacetylase (PgdA/CDA1 family)